MKAVELTDYGAPGVLKLNEYQLPKIKKNELLIKVHAASVNFGDVLMRKFKSITPGKFNMPFFFWLPAKFYFGFRKPKIKIPGNEFSGIVVETGKHVKLFKTGDAVYGYTGMKMGSQAEYLKIPEKGAVSLIPENISFEEAAGVPYGALMAFSLIRKINGKTNYLNGKEILIIGASGNIGSAAVQLSRYFGAVVTGSCSKLKSDFVRSIGADEVIEHYNNGFLLKNIKFDIIIDVLGKSNFLMLKPFLKDNGKCYFLSFKFKQIILMIFSGLFMKKKLICTLLSENSGDLSIIKVMIENGDYKPVIDKSFDMVDIAEAHRYVDKGNKKGNVVITVG